MKMAVVFPLQETNSTEKDRDFDDMFYSIREEFISEVFDINSTVTRAHFESAVEAKAPWIFQTK